MSGDAVINAFYSHDYCVRTRNGGMEKLAGVAEAAAQSPAITIRDPGVIDVDHLFRLHDPAYVRDFLDGTPPLARSQNLPWSPALRTAVLAMQAGQLRATEAARCDGIAVNIANGFHHARHARGSGFCTFNGLALVALAHPDYRVAVLDCDQHGGDGTEDFAARLPNLYNYSIFGTSFGCNGGVRSVIDPIEKGRNAERRYMAAVARACTQIRAWQPDLLIYQAGVDCHMDDPLGRGPLSGAGLIQRDQRVFEFCRSEGLPVLVTLAGGYQAFSRTVDLHMNTFEIAAAVYREGIGEPAVAGVAQPVADG